MRSSTPLKRRLQRADMLNDRVLPFYEKHALPMLCILTDRGTKYCGRAISMTTRFTTHWTISSTLKLRSSHLKPTASVSGFTRPFSMSFIRWSCVKKSTKQSMSFKSILTKGWLNTILNELTKVKCAAGERRWKLSSTVNQSGRKSLWTKLNRTVGYWKTGNGQIKSEFLHKGSVKRGTKNPLLTGRTPLALVTLSTWQCLESMVPASFCWGRQTATTHWYRRDGA